MPQTADEPDETAGSTNAMWLLLIGMVTFGSATPISKIVTEALPPLLGGGLRVTLGASALAIAAWPQRHAIAAIRSRDWGIIAGIALFGMFGFTAAMLYGMRMISGVEGSIVMSTTPAVTAAGAMLFLGDRPSWRKGLAIALAVSGVLLLQLGSGGSADGDSQGMWLGLGLVFLAVCCEAAYTLFGKAASRHVPPLLVATLGAALSLPLFLPFALWQSQDVAWEQVDVRAWIALAWYGLGTLALGSWAWYAGVARVAGSTAAAFMGVMPASALVLSYLLLGEPFRWLHLAGFGVVFMGVLLISWEHARSRP